jgi:uncharacterized repeat protein (TIGR02543 family)
MIIMSILTGFCILGGILSSNTATNRSAVSDSNTESKIEPEPEPIETKDTTAAQIAEYAITSDGNGNTYGKAPVDNNRYLSGTLAELKDEGTLSKDGYKFNGWNENKDADTWYVDPEIVVNRDITLYAIWEEYTAADRRTDFADILADEPTESNLVYITSSGTKYHRANCRTLSRSPSRQIAISDALNRGYLACTVCNP